MMTLRTVLSTRLWLIGALVAQLAFFSGCFRAENSFTRVAPGMWRGMLLLEKTYFGPSPKDSVAIVYEDFHPGDLPFNFEVTYLDDERFYLEIINGDERIKCDSIVYGRDRTTARDTFNVFFPEYQSYLHIEVRGNVMQGYWNVTTKEDYRIPFVADSGKGYRFTPMTEKPDRDLTGEWAALFGVNEEKAEPAIGEFKQTGNRLTGTFRTETGDYRFLEGTVQGRKFWLSCFDGAHAFLFSGSIQGDSLQGEFRSGKSYKSLWTAWKDPNFKLGDANSLTTYQDNAAVSLQLTKPNGQPLTYPGSAFDGKVSIFTIMGTWCPNCRDEQQFLTQYLAKHPDQASKIAVVGCSFERGKEASKINAHLTDYKKTMGIPYDIVYAGKADKNEAAKLFPGLSQVMAFPTMIIVDKKGKVRRVHTGFDGPATSKYQAFSSEFESFMTTLTGE